MALGDPYITAGDLEAHLGASSLSPAESERACSAASRWVDGYCDRTFATSAEPSTRLFRVADPSRVWIDDVADSTVTVADGDGYVNDWTAAEFLLEPTQPAQGWPYTSIRSTGSRLFSTHAPGLVQVTATWGWPAVPADVQLATLIQAARLYKRRESPEGVLGGNDFGLVRVGTRVDPDVAALLDPYRLTPIGIA